MKKKIKNLMVLIGFAFVLCVPLVTSGVVCSTTPVAYAQESVLAQESDEENEAQDESSADSFDWSEWFNDKALPVLISVGAAIVTICSVLYPILNTVNGGIKLFKKSKDEFDTVTTKVVETQSSITEFKETSLAKIEALKTQMEEEISKISADSKAEIEAISNIIAQTFEEFSTEIKDLILQVENELKIMKIAFGNNEELVKNGYANEIMKIGAENGSEENQTETDTNANS